MASTPWSPCIAARAPRQPQPNRCTVATTCVVTGIAALIAMIWFSPPCGCSSIMPKPKPVEQLIHDNATAWPAFDDHVSRDQSAPGDAKMNVNHLQNDAEENGEHYMQVAVEQSVSAEQWFAAEQWHQRLQRLGGQLLHRMKGHRGYIWSLAMPNDMAVIASAGADASTRLWNITTGKCTLTTESHNGTVVKVAISPDGQTVASASSDKTIQLRSLSGTLLRELLGHTSEVADIAFSPDGRILASGSSDKTIRLWDVESGKIQQTLRGHNDSTFAVAFSQDGRLLASGSPDKEVRIWDVHSGSCITTLKRHTGGVWNVAFSPDGLAIATAARDNTVRLWSIAGDQLRVFRGHTACVRSICFLRDGEELITAAKDGTVRLWNTATAEELRVLPMNTTGNIVCNSDGSLLLSANDAHEVLVYGDASP